MIVDFEEMKLRRGAAYPRPSQSSKLLSRFLPRRLAKCFGGLKNGRQISNPVGMGGLYGLEVGQSSGEAAGSQSR